VTCLLRGPERHVHGVPIVLLNMQNYSVHLTGISMFIMNVIITSISIIIIIILCCERCGAGRGSLMSTARLYTDIERVRFVVKGRPQHVDI
jgi:hypothetical protein